jgi:hypothetical protein
MQDQVKLVGKEVVRFAAADEGEHHPEPLSRFYAGLQTPPRSEKVPG